MEVATEMELVLERMEEAEGREEGKVAKEEDFSEEKERKEVKEVLVILVGGEEVTGRKGEKKVEWTVGVTAGEAMAEEDLKED